LRDQKHPGTLSFQTLPVSDTTKVALFPNLIVVANSKIKLELSAPNFTMTLLFTIRHQYQIDEEPLVKYQKWGMWYPIRFILGFDA
jgi:hypothetical protein